MDQTEFKKLTRKVLANYQEFRIEEYTFGSNVEQVEHDQPTLIELTHRGPSGIDPAIFDKIKGSLNANFPLTDFSVTSTGTDGKTVLWLYFEDNFTKELYNLQ